MANGAAKKGNAFLTVIGLVRPRLKRYLLGLIVFTFAEVSFYVSIPFVKKLMIDAAIGKDLGGLWRGIAFILTVSASGAVAFVLFMYLFCICVYRITATIRTRAFGRALELPARYYESRHSGDVLSRLTNDVNSLRNSYDWPLFNLLMTLVAGTGAVIAMFALDWRISLFLIATSAAFAFLNAKFSSSIKKTSDEIQKAMGAITEATGNVLAGFSVIRQFGLRQRMQAGFEERNAEVLAKSEKRSAMSAWLDTYNSLIGWINFSGVLALGAVLAGQGRMSFGSMVALVNYLWNVNRMIRETGRNVAHFQAYLAGAARVEELEREEAEPGEIPRERFARPEAAGAAIEMRGVSFSYDGKKPALDGFDLTALAGQTIALVGPSGGGKSTVLKILLGFHAPSAGTVAVGTAGRELRALRDLRDATAYVPQDPFMFEGSIAENIAYGKPGASRAEIEEAARLAQVLDFALGFERGLDTPVGERGVKLSGGQRQRIAIARAFLKDAPILLLDEATSSLDSHSEKSIQQALERLGGKKTVVVVAHRLSTVEGADRIYVVDRGRAVEEGTHAELLAAGGLYAKLHGMGFALEGDSAVREA